MTDHTDLVEATCAKLRAAGQPVTFTAVATNSGLSRTTLYRNPELRALIDDHHRHDPASITDLRAELTHLRTALEVIAEHVRRHEERLRRLEGRTAN